MTNVGTLEYWAAVSPSAIAVTSDEAALTYAEWNQAADALAEHLHRSGVRTGDRVAVRSRLRTEWFIANRAVGKLGAEHLALNWRLTARECRAILEQAGAVALICDDREPQILLDELATLELRSTLTVTPAHRTEWEAIIATGDVPSRQGPSQVPQLVYTSGTTGLPKGVSWHDRLPADDEGRAEYFAAIAGTPPRAEHPSTLLTMPVHHSAGYFETVWTHERGGRLCLLDPFDPERALQLVQEFSISHWLAVPTMFHRIRALPKETFAAYDLSSLRTLQTGAAPVPRALKEWIRSCFGEGLLWELYGTTEAATISAMTPQDNVERPDSSGRPLPGVDVRIIDSEWRDLPVEALGEVAVRTPAVIGRYFGQADLAADSLSSDGFLRTGDVGRLDEDGYLYITDRAKDMIVAGGSNIYPAEVEAALIEHPAIVDAAVIGVPHDDLGEQPIAFVEAAAGSDVGEADVLQFLSGRLAKFKHPRRLIVQEALPRNPVGKVLKQQLREPYWRGREKSI